MSEQFNEISKISNNFNFKIADLKAINDEIKNYLNTVMEKCNYYINDLKEIDEFKSFDMQDTEVDKALKEKISNYRNKVKSIVDSIENLQNKLKTSSLTDKIDCNNEILQVKKYMQDILGNSVSLDLKAYVRTVKDVDSKINDCVSKLMSISDGFELDSSNLDPAIITELLKLSKELNINVKIKITIERK